MPKLAVEATCELSHIGSVSFPPDYAFHFRLKCCNCGEEAPKPVVISRGDEVEGIRGANVSAKVTCKLCARTNDITLLRTFDYTAEDSGSYKKVIELECRGLEPTQLLLADDTPLQMTGETGALLDDTFIVDAEYYSYDDSASTEVSLTEFDSRVIRAK